MSEETVSAEVSPKSNKARQAALALQRLGFKVLHISSTISVEGPVELWQKTFEVSFERRTRRIMREVESGEAPYLEAQTEHLLIPEALSHLVAAIYFVEPPELL